MNIKHLITAHIPVSPERSTHQSALRILKNKNSGKMFVGKMSNSKASKYKKALTLAMKEAMLSKDKEIRSLLPIKNHVKVAMLFSFPAPKSRAKLFKDTQSIPMVVKPDWDNLAKIPFDCLVDAGILVDDNLIYSAEVTKHEIPPHEQGFITLFIYVY